MSDDTAEAIVREWAAAEPPFDEAWCVYCGIMVPDEHKPTCLYRRACEWAVANSPTTPAASP